MRFNQFKKFCSVITTLIMFQTLPLTAYASEKEKFLTKMLLMKLCSPLS